MIVDAHAADSSTQQDKPDQGGLPTPSGKSTPSLSALYGMHLAGKLSGNFYASQTRNRSLPRGPAVRRRLDGVSRRSLSSPEPSIVIPASAAVYHSEMIIRTAIFLVVVTSVCSRHNRDQARHQHARAVGFAARSHSRFAQASAGVDHDSPCRGIVDEQATLRPRSFRRISEYGGKHQRPRDRAAAAEHVLA